LKIWSRPITDFVLYGQGNYQTYGGNFITFQLTI